jgi:osmoprotectant transport system permease protein
VFVVATATLSGFFGGGGLGDIINNRESYRLSGVIAASYVVIALAFVVQLLLLGIERLVTPAGLRLSRRPGRGGMAAAATGDGDLLDDDRSSDPDRGELAPAGNQPDR